jgi:hypothetical protein
MTKKKKFTQDIADILADDLALLDAIEPGSVVRPDIPARAAQPAPVDPPAAAAPEVTPVPSPPEPMPEPVPAPEPAPPEPVPEPLPAPMAAAETAPSDQTATRPRAPQATAPGSAHTQSTGPFFSDAVTLLEIAPPESGGVRESALPLDRSQSPPPPQPARRIGWHNPVLAWTAYVLITAALALFFIYILVLLFHV